MTFVPSRMRGLAASPVGSKLRRILAALTLAVSGIAQLDASPADNAAEVERLIAQGSYGQPPVLWFAKGPETNSGSGSPNWRANSGGRLEARGLDPWGRGDAAFGPLATAEGAAAVSGSTASNILNPAQGSVLFFCRPGALAQPPMILFCLGEWGDENYFSLRINNKKSAQKNWNLTIAAADPGNVNKASQFEFANIKPNDWFFVAISWSEQGNIRTLNYWAGSLGDGELVEGRQDLNPMSRLPGTLLLCGRRRDRAKTLPNLVFADGLISQFAIYDSALSDDTVKRIYLAASRR